jgi:predicted nuclease of predicted toxin-antitoxin system
MFCLLDAMLSWRLAAELSAYFPAKHVSQCGLLYSKNIDIWRYAKLNGAFLLTADNDYLDLSATFGAPPKVIMLRIGNRKPSEVKQIIVNNLEAIGGFLQDPDLAVLEIAA